MAVVTINAFRTQPGRLADHLAASAEARGHLERLGLAAATINCVYGSDAGTIATLINHESNAAMAAAMQAIGSDQAFQEYWAKAASAGAAVPVEASILQDLDPEFRPPADRPMGVILGVQWQAKPGRMADFIGNVMEAAPLIEGMGGRVRVMQSLLGAHPMTTLVSTAFADLDAYGAYADKTATSAEWQEFWGRAMSDPTADVVRSGLYTNISG